MNEINWHTFFFLVSAGLTCLFAVAVVLSANIVRMAFYLVLSLAGVAALFFLAGADFVAAMQLMIYVGGTLVLLAFGVMLTARGPFVRMKTGGGQWVLAVLVAGALVAVLLQAALSVPDWNTPPTAAAASAATSAPIGMGLLGVRVDRLEPANPRLEPGMAGYLLPFEIVSVHLVVVLVGAAYLARARRRRPPSAIGGQASDA